MESVFNQSFNNYELILIDDGSTDKSGLICDSYAENNSKIVVLHIKNSGPSHARNTGIEKARGAYFLFLDGDDYFSTASALDLIHKNITDYNSEVCVFSYQKYWHNKKRLGGAAFAGIAPDTDIRRAIEITAYKAMASNKAVSRSLFASHNLRFPTGKLAEDFTWCADLLYFSDKISFCGDGLYVYRQRDGSTTQNKDESFNKRRFDNALSQFYELFKKYPKTLKDGLIYHYLACEYVFLLADVYPYWNDFKLQINDLSFLLEFSLSKKVRKANIFAKCFGLYATSFALNNFVKLKRIINE